MHMTRRTSSGQCPAMWEETNPTSGVCLQLNHCGGSTDQRQTRETLRQEALVPSAGTPQCRTAVPEATSAHVETRRAGTSTWEHEPAESVMACGDVVITFSVSCNSSQRPEQYISHVATDGGLGSLLSARASYLQSWSLSRSLPSEVLGTSESMIHLAEPLRPPLQSGSK